MAQPAPSDNIQVHIEGAVTGQVAVGNYILQIGSVHGGVVNVTMPGEQPQPRPRPTPLFLRPRPFPGLLDRSAEVGGASNALRSATPVEFTGPGGVGKTSLLRHLAHAPLSSSFPDGVVYLPARGQPVADLLQALYEAFYESSAAVKPTDTQIRHALQGKRALILLDDVALTGDEVKTVLDAAPGCTFALAATARHLWGEGHAVALHGLPPADALALVERELGRSLTPEERPHAQALCAALEGHPLRILQAAALARDEGVSLAEITHRVQSQRPVEAQALAALSEPEQRVVAALATLNGAPLDADHLSALAGIPDIAAAVPGGISDIASVLETLRQRGLVQTHSPSFGLTGALNEDLPRVWDLTSWAEQTLRYFTAWAEEHRDEPDRLQEEAGAILQVLEWAARAGRWAEVLRLGRAVEGGLALGGRWGAWLQVLDWVHQAAQALGDKPALAWALHQTGTRALCLGEVATARAALTNALQLREALGDRIGAAVTRHNLDLLLGPPAPPRRPSEPPSKPAPSGVRARSLLLPLIGVGALLSVVVLVAGALGLWYLLRPRPEPTIGPPDREGPGAPQLIAPEPEAGIPCDAGEERTLVELEWTVPSDPSGIDGYEVSLEALERDPRTYPTEFTEEPFQEADLPCDEVYVWRVRATDGAGNEGAWSEERVFVTTREQDDERDTQGPAAPNLVAPNDEEIDCQDDIADVTFQWTEVEDPSGIAGYIIRWEAIVNETPTRPTPVPATVDGVDGTTFEAPLDCDWSYRWQVRAVDGAGNEGGWSEEGGFRVVTEVENDDVPPPAPVPLEPGNADETDSEGVDCPVTLRWKPVDDPSGVVYLVRVERFGAGEEWVLEQSRYPVSDAEWEVSGASCKMGLRYRWRVMAQDGAGNWSEGEAEWLYYGIPIP